jgi:Ca2+-binding RTX toxin-like protein
MKPRAPRILALAMIGTVGIFVSSSLVSTAAAAETCAGRTATIVGTEGNDRLRGTNGADVIVGLGGNDKIDGKKGDDFICGGAGDDELRGHLGNDHLDGGLGTNSLNGGGGQDACRSGARTACETEPPPSSQAPTVTTQSSIRHYTEDDGSDPAIDNQLTVTDPDSTQIQSAVIRISQNFNAAEDELRLGNPDWVSGSYDDTTGTLHIFGVATVAQYQDALASSGYYNSSEEPSGTKTITFQVTDVEGATSNIAQRTIQLHSTPE